MIRGILLISLLFSLGGCLVFPEGAPLPEADWTLTFSDEFDGTGNPDTAKWQSENYLRRDNPDGPDGWWDSNFAKLDGEGNLILSVARIPNRNGDNDPYDFAVGMVSTKGLFEQRFGRFEMRGRLPQQTGWWTAFWLHSRSAADVGNAGRDGTEIDILEGFGQSDRIGHALHWDGNAESPQSEVKKFNWPGVSAGFHTHAVEWSPTEYIFFVDGEETWRTAAGGVSKVPAYVKLTGEISTLDWAVGSDWAGSIDPAAFPDKFIIDYVRVWSK